MKRQINLFINNFHFIYYFFKLLMMKLFLYLFSKKLRNIEYSMEKILSINVTPLKNWNVKVAMNIYIYVFITNITKQNITLGILMFNFLCFKKIIRDNERFLRHAYLFWIFELSHPQPSLFVFGIIFYAHRTSFFLCSYMFLHIFR